jgi:Tol biopolymer transport system component
VECQGRGAVATAFAALVVCGGACAPNGSNTDDSLPISTIATTVASTATSNPAAAPSGTIVYSSDVDGDDDVYVVVLDDGQPVQLTDDPEKEFDPDLSPDGTTIAYRRNPHSHSDEADIWVMDIDGGNKRNLTNAPERSNWAPAWTPDGRIVFSSIGDSSGELELWSMDADGGSLRRVASGWCEYVDPSPDGTEFVCAAAVGRAYDIVIVDAQGGRRSVTDTPITEFAPSWSPDGAWITFSRDLGERWELVRIRPDGSDESVVATEGVFSTWTEDGHLVWTGVGGINITDGDGTDHVVLDYPANFISWGGRSSLTP